MDKRYALHPKKEVFTGFYFPTRPNAPDDERTRFVYEYITPSSRRWQTLGDSNIINTRGAELTIRAHDDVPFKVCGYVLLQDNKFFEIAEAALDYSTAPRQAFRYFKSSPQVSYVLRLIEVDAPWLDNGDYYT